MPAVIVPTEVKNAINARLDDALNDYPGAIDHREEFYQEILRYYDEHGEIPDVEIHPRIMTPWDERT